MTSKRQKVRVAAGMDVRLAGHPYPHSTGYLGISFPFDFSLMKTIRLILGLLCANIMSSEAQNIGSSADAKQPAAASSYRVVDQGANHRVWQWETDEQLPDGTVLPHVHSYTELASGLNYQDANGQWQESQELIEAFPGGAVARQGQYQVIFANDLNSAGAVDLQTPDGKRLRSNILGLMYVDTATGDAAMVAAVQDSSGELVSSNQVLYPDAFDGVKADVQYTYKRGSFEQDVILREQPPTPESLGMNPETTELEVVTEFIDPPNADIEDAAAKEPGLEADENISWGVMNLGHGKAFDLAGAGGRALVAKRYVTIQGRQFLLEKVRVKDIQPSLSKLPEQASNEKPSPVMALAKLAMPKTPSVRWEAKPMRLASTTSPDKGYVLDYVTLNASFTNYTFRADTTYYVSGTVTLNGGTLEGGTVIKYAKTSTGINWFGGVNCDTSPYRPAIFTAADDNSVGETISGSSGSPSGTYAFTYLVVYCPSCSVDLEYLRFSYATYGIELYDSTDNYIRNCQFYGNGSALELLQNTSVENCLFQKGLALDGGGSASVSLVNCTVHNVSQLNAVHALSATNCMLIGVTNLGPAFTSVNNYTNLYDAGIFQGAGAGNDYLAASSPYRGVGLTNNISPALLASLKKKTTYAPTVLSNVTYSVNTTLSPQAPRDTNATDLGYHYDPLDYLTCNCAVTNNVVLTIANGTAIANYNTNGIWLQDGSSLVSTGTPLNPNWLVRYQSVQEQPVLLGGSSPAAGVPVGAYHFNNSAPSAAFRFNKFTCPANGGCDVYHVAFPYNFTNLLVQDCEFWSGANYFGGGTNSATLLKNNLFWRTPFVATSTASNSLSLSNNLFVLISSKIQITQPTGSVWNAFNNMFDTCWIDSAATCSNGYNAYYTSTNVITPVSAGNIVSFSTFYYSSGALGNYYQLSTSLPVNRGSTTADVAGLYHYTTQSTQKKETNSVVDIGYHYVALDTNGLPLDTNGDGIPDYLEDANGNGFVDTNEIPWSLPLTNLVLWLKADAIIGLTNNAPIATWPDQSGKGNNATQASSGNRPLYITNVINGMPVVRFNAASSQYLSLPNFLTGTTGAEAMVVLKVAVNPPLASRFLWWYGLSSWDAYPTTAGHIVEGFGSTTIYDLGVPAQPLTQYHLYDVSGSSGNWGAWINGVLQGQASGNTYATNPASTYYLGRNTDGGYLFDGDVAEVLVFNRPLTSGERNALGLYVFSKFNLPQNSINTNPPTTPTLSVVNVVGANQFYLSWSQSDNASDYHLERKLGTTGVYQEIAAFPSYIKGFLDMTAIAENQYFYRIRARNFYGYSAYSSEVPLHLDSNGDGIADVLQVLQGNDPLDPWIPPALNPSDHTAPAINLMIPTNAVVIP
jgi:parallel beta-helix repeat protein